MKKVLCVAVLLGFFACSDEAKTPVDMSYRVTVESLENTCDDTVVPEGTTAVIDVMANGNETVTFVSRNSSIPGEGYYRGLVVRGGEVDITFNVEAVGHDFHHDFKGKLTMDKIDMTIRVADRDYRQDEFVECHKKVRLRGDRRPLWDATTIDGHHRVQFKNYGRRCPGEELRTPATWNAPMDLSPHQDGRVTVGFDERESVIFFDLNLASGGDVGELQSTTMYFISNSGTMSDIPLRVSGFITPALTELRLVYDDPNSTSGCEYVADVRGGKFFPTPNLSDNEYRVNYLVTDDCDRIVNGKGPHESEFDLRVDAVFQGDGRVNLLESPWRVPLTLDGNTFDNSFFYNWGEAIISYKGSFEPPFLNYVIDWHFWEGQKYECHRRFEATGHARYWFEGDDLSSTRRALMLPKTSLAEEESFFSAGFFANQSAVPMLTPLN